MKSGHGPNMAIVTFLWLGILAAALTIFVPALLMTHASLIGPGPIFGACIAIYFWFFARIRSIVKAVALLVVSTVAYYAATFSGMFLGMFVSGALGLHPDGSSLSADMTPGMIAPMFVGGAVGAFMVLAAVLRLYSSDSWGHAAKKSLLGASVGGALGVVGWALGPSLGEAVWSALNSWHLSDLPHSTAAAGGNLNFNSVHIVWQIGMSVVLGVIASRIPLESPSPNADAKPAQKWSYSNIILFAVMTLALGWYLIRIIPSDLQSMRGHRASAAHAAEKPSMQNLPEVTAKSANTMLVLSAFGDYRPETPHAGIRAWSYSAPFPVGSYTVRYSHPGAPTSGQNVGPHVDINVQEWPNADWAKWELAENFFSPSLDSGMEETTQFGNRIIGLRKTDENTKRVWGEGGRFGWYSGPYIVIVEGYSASLDEMLQTYLKKYPSSL